MAACLFATLFPYTGLADALTPAGVVKASIIAAREDKLRLFLTFVDLVSLQTQTKQARSPEEVVLLLKGIDPKSMTLDNPRGERKAGARTTVAMSSPLRLRFVVLCTGLPDGEPRWKIVEIYNQESAWKSKLNDGTVVAHIGSCSGTTEAADHVEALLAAHGIWAGTEGSRAYTIFVREADAGQAKELLRSDPQMERFHVTVYPD